MAELQPASREPWAWGHVAVGGTFDRLHAGHRILLAATALAATQAVYIGVTGPELLQKKVGCLGQLHSQYDYSMYNSLTTSKTLMVFVCFFFLVFRSCHVRR